MKLVFTMILYGLTFSLMALSFYKNRDKTIIGIKKGLAMMLGVLPYFMAIQVVTGAALMLLSPDIIQRFLGAESGLRGMVLSALAGAAILVPVLAVFPIVSELLEHGAGAAQMAIFISTLTTVGFVTIPLEVKYLGSKIALLRNLLFFLSAFVTSYLLGAII